MPVQLDWLLPVTDELAVVPVFVNVGAAVLPALIAGIATFFSLLFKPRELAAFCKEKPYIPVILVIVCVGGYFLISWLLTPPAAGPPAAAETAAAHAPGGYRTPPEEWVRLARDLAAAEDNAAPHGGDAAPQSPYAVQQEILKTLRQIKDQLRRRPTATAGNRADQDPGTDPAGGDAPAPDDADGPQTALIFRGNMQRNGHLGGPAPTRLQQLWKYEEEDAIFWSSPIVHGSRIYSAWCILDPPGSFGAIVCLDARTGKRIWEIDVKPGNKDFKGFFSSPALTADGKYLVIGQGLHPDYDSELICVDTARGKVKWMAPCPLHIESSPAIAGDIVVAGAGSVEDAKTHLPRPHDDPVKNQNPGYVFAVRISTGKMLWKHVVNDPESSPAIADGVVYIGSGFNGNAVAALRLKGSDAELKAKGLKREIWKAATPHPATGAVTITGDTVLVGCGNGDYVFQAQNPQGLVIALDRKTGKERWRRDMPDGVLGAVAVKGSTAIAPVRNGDLVALNLAQQGKELWRTKVRDGAKALAGPAFTGTHVYAVSHDGYLVVFDAKTGNQLERHYINSTPGEMGMSIASPLVVGGRVYVASETGGIRCFVSQEPQQ